MPVVGALKLVVITRDKRIRYRPAEKAAWVEHGVRGFVLTGKKSQSTVDSLAVLGRHWAAIEAIVESELEGPWMRSVTQAEVRAIDLE